MKSINELARDAGWIIRDDLHYMDHQAMQDALLERIKRFASLIRNATLDEAAGVCEVYAKHRLIWEMPDEYAYAARECAEDIRQLKETK